MPPAKIKPNQCIYTDMKSAAPNNEQDCNFDLLRWMLDKHGPLMGGTALYTALGFRTYAAFHCARMYGDVNVHVFTIEGRRGLFALTADVAAWLQAASHRKKEDAMDP
jgi:hypothetical protein